MMLQRYGKGRAVLTLLLCAVVLPCLAGGIAFAQQQTLSALSDSVFVVTRINVRAEAVNATKAKFDALEQGRKQALDLLLRRLTAEEDWVYLPKLATNEPADAELLMALADFDTADFGAPPEEGRIGNKKPVAIAHVVLAQLEEGIGIFDEKSSQTTYSAQITYRFKPDAIREMLSLAGLPFSDSQSRPALVLPVLQTEQGGYLWEHNNAWARAWLARPLINELTPFLLPVGDITDVDMISVRDVLELDQGQLARLARRYGVAQIILAHALLVERDDLFHLRVQLRDAYLQGADRTVTVYDADHSDFLYDEGPTTGDLGHIFTQGYYKGGNADFPVLARRAVESIVVKHATDWKNQTLVDHSSATDMRINAYFDGLEDWNMIRSALRKSPLLREMKVSNLTQGGALIQVQVMGKIAQLVLAMQQHGLVMWRTQEYHWNIATTRTASIMRERLKTYDTTSSRPGFTDSRQDASTRQGRGAFSFLRRKLGERNKANKPGDVPTVAIPDFQQEEAGLRGNVLYGDESGSRALRDDATTGSTAIEPAAENAAATDPLLDEVLHDIELLQEAKRLRGQ